MKSIVIIFPPVIITLSITIMMLLLIITEVTLLDYANQTTINLYETLMSDKMTEPKRMEFMDLEYIRMINVITCTSHLLSACLWFRQQCTGNLETREQISIVMMIRFYGNDPLVTRHFACNERDWAEERSKGDIRDWINQERPEPFDDLNWLLPWDRGPGSLSPQQDSVTLTSSQQCPGSVPVLQPPTSGTGTLTQAVGYYTSLCPPVPGGRCSQLSGGHHAATTFKGP